MGGVESIDPLVSVYRIDIRGKIDIDLLLSTQMMCPKMLLVNPDRKMNFLAYTSHNNAVSTTLHCFSKEEVIERR